MATSPKPKEQGLKEIASSPVVETAEKDAKPFITFYKKFNNDWVLNFAAMLAYNLLMSMVPIALAVLSIIGLILGKSMNAAILNDIQHILPSNVSGNVIENISNKINSISGFLGIVAIVLAIFFGSRLFVSIENCFDIIYHVRPRSVIRQNMMAILMLLLFVILIPIMIFTSSAPALIISFISLTPLRNVAGLGFVIYLAGIASGLIASFILFEAIYIVVPNQHISFRHSWLGAVIAAIALELYLLLFPLYASNLLKGYAGAVGFAVILLIFFYYFAVILLLGAEVNAFFSEKVQPLPNDLATFVTTLAGKLNKDRPSLESPSHQNPHPTNRADEKHIEEASGTSGPMTNQSGHSRKPQQPTTDTRQATNVASGQLPVQQNSTVQDTPVNRRARGNSKLPTIFEVVAGTALAFVIELLRLRQHSH